MSTVESDTLKCRLRFIGLWGCVLDENLNLTLVNGIESPIISLPYGLHGLLGVGFSGLEVEVIKFNKELVLFEDTSLANCAKLRELHVYKSQLEMVSCLSSTYPDLMIKVRKEIE